MRKRSYALGAVLVALVLVILPACNLLGGGLKVGVVTDVGTVDDHNFNQYSWEGAQAGANDIGASSTVVVPQNSSDYATKINDYVEQGYGIIVTVGFLLTNDTLTAAKANPDIDFIGVDQFPCITPEGAPDLTFACAGTGDIATLIPNFQGLLYAEAQAGYLAGIVAGSLTQTNEVATLGGPSFVPPVWNYMRGFQNGVASVNPGAKVDYVYASEDPVQGFNDPDFGKTFGDQFLQQNPNVDFLFQVAGKTGNGFIAAACDAGIYAIGVDVDEHLSLDPSPACLVTSAEKHLAASVQAAVNRTQDEAGYTGGIQFNDATNDGIGLSGFYDYQSMITPEIQAAIDAALAGLADGSVDECSPTPCTSDGT